MSTVTVDVHERVDIYEIVDGRKKLQASVLRRPGYVPQLRIPQEGHSATDESGNFCVYISAEVLVAIGAAGGRTEAAK